MWRSSIVDGFLNRIFQPADRILDLTSGFFRFAFVFEFGVSGYFTGDFFTLPWPAGAALNAIFVHSDLIVLIVGIILTQRRGTQGRSTQRNVTRDPSSAGQPYPAHALRPRANPWRRGASAFALTRYCFEPVVLLFGLGEQFRFCGFASFSQAAMLAYLQFNAPLADVLMQNGELPIVWDFCMLLPDDGEPIVP